MKLKFTKMHGLGNDFVMVDSFSNPVDLNTGTIKHLCDRNFGIGADQLLWLKPSDRADFEMLIFNANGEKVEMCGNGIRCAALYMRERQGLDKSPMEVDTLAGIIKPEFDRDLIRVDMGKPDFEASKFSTFEGEIMGQELEVLDRKFKIHLVSMGNPHCVIFVEDVNTYQVPKYGPVIEHSDKFPKGINVEFTEIINPSSINLRVWERGSGETMACGTGACATAAAAHKLGLINDTVEITLPGGKLSISPDVDGHVFKTGPAKFVFDGQIDTNLFFG